MKRFIYTGFILLVVCCFSFLSACSSNSAEKQTSFEELSGLTKETVDKITYEPLMTAHPKTEITDPEEIAAIWDGVDRAYTAVKMKEQSVGAHYRLIFHKGDYKYTMLLWGGSYYTKDDYKFIPDTPMDLTAVDKAVATEQ